jgi:hypothetical protein
MSDLAAVLRRAASFLEALPEDVPKPRKTKDYNGTIWYEWKRDARHWVAVSCIQPGELLWVWADGPDNGPATNEWAGGSVPPEIVAAIRRVVS